MKNEEYVPVIEAALFAAGFPVKFERLEEVLGLSHDDLLELLRSKAFEYKGRGIRLVMFSDSCQLCSNEEYEKQVKSILGMRSGGALSNSALEVLAIIAYNQPVTKAFIEQVRGVDSSYAVTTLGEKQLIEVTGRLDVPGKPNLYGTTDTFLRCFGLGSLDELPKSEVLDAVTSRAEETETEPESPDAPAMPEGG
ncbi:MAG: SMC-Scp complex subunit ScpB [Firmicutes bacterium]|jgi:segregation and condensation protein B|uniref:SMC-Scp complex subunit ScpB n=1 Tax=Candidatus Colimorpha enterica TaxID=3083063 RepID=A0AAE3FGY8_9BACT|nr:SMC-Scp complex subunit ScpB [Candidatus Colimorpha enterica]MDY2905948.1 SMC-Scp complex subunit ScpB [Eubacteriales bacterium]